MELQGRRSRTILDFFIIVLAFAAVISILNLLGNMGIITAQKGMLQNFCTIFLSIILEAVPFVLLGSFVSALIQVFVSEDMIAGLIPKNRFLGLLAAALMGFIIPVCECAIVPIARRLIKKGVPLNIAVTFMLAVPIVNPVVLASTYYAFYDKPLMVFLRGGLGAIGAITIGFLIGWIEDGKVPLKHNHTCSHSHHHECSCGHHHEEEHSEKPRVIELIEHTSLEFYDVGKYLIAGAFISTTFQVFFSRNYILEAGKNSPLSIAVMLLFAYIISLCSEADAFIARTFLGSFTTGSITAFLILGPMIDIKNTLMLGSAFKKGFVARLIFIIFSVCFIFGAVINGLRL